MRADASSQGDTVPHQKLWQAAARDICQEALQKTPHSPCPSPRGAGGVTYWDQPVDTES